ncbi:serine/threonine-protein kinase [Polyangium aurulentum]|uniref:serine/threonine-protein kinase n=1 Tax=Polyangium aurulentum TaxID=2567896 RepID=UPI0010AEB2DC|nr:serine/threonine-protein kinase [Polyangium aurulentum]UQA62347.1 protein kinase [Polyangium aurulentum]
MFPTEPVPERIGAYKVLRRVAGTGSADVYVGRMEGPMGFQRFVTLKLVPNTIEGDTRFAEELGREAAICSQLNHPAIVRMFDFFEHDRHLVLVLEHIDGVQLDRLVQHVARRKQNISDAAIAYMGREIAGALAHAHAARDEDGRPTPVIHRNLIPDNVVVGWDGQVRLMGFGLGKIMGRTPDTVAGVIKGAPGFMAPEQARGDRATPRSDVYGLGLLLWSLFTAKRPPDGGLRPARLSILRTDLPRELAEAIDGALEPLPDKRTVTCADLERLLGMVGKAEQGREELREKALMMRGARTPTTETTETRMPSPVGRGPAPPARTPPPRRRVPMQAVRPGKPPASSQKRLSLPPPSKPPGRMSERPPGGILDEEAPKSVYPLLRALADRVPKPPLLPSEEESPPPKRVEEARPSQPEPPEPRPMRHSIAVPIGLEESANEWMESVPDEDSIDRFFEEAISMGPDELHKRAEKAAEKRDRRTPPPPMPGGKAAGRSAPPAPARPRLTPPPPLPQPKAPSFGGRPETPPAPRAELAETIPAHAPLAAPPPLVTPNPPSFGMPAPSFGAPPAPATSPIRFGPPPAAAPAAVPPQFAAPPLGAPPQAAPVAGTTTAGAWQAPNAPRQSRRPSAMVLAIAGVITGLVAAAIVVFALQREGGGGSTPENAPSPSAIASTLPTTLPATGSSGSPEAPRAGDPVVPVDLPPGFGYLTVDFPTPGNVYISGRKLGPTGQRLQVQCGRWFVRVANQGDSRFPEWVSPGETVLVPCQDATRVEMKPGAARVEPTKPTKPTDTKKKKTRFFGD